MIGKHDTRSVGISPAGRNTETAQAAGRTAVEIKAGRVAADTMSADEVQERMDRAVAFLDRALDSTAIPRRDPFRIVMKGLSLVMAAQGLAVRAILDVVKLVRAGPAVSAAPGADNAEAWGAAAGAAAGAHFDRVIEQARVRMERAHLRWAILTTGVNIAVGLTVLAVILQGIYAGFLARARAVDAAEHAREIAAMNDGAKFYASWPELGGALAQYSPQELKPLAALLREQEFIREMMTLDMKKRIRIVMITQDAKVLYDAKSMHEVWPCIIYRSEPMYKYRANDAAVCETFMGNVRNNK